MNMIVPLRNFVLIVLWAAVSVSGCQTTYYAVWEKLGKEKRHLLRDQVEKASVDQQKASEQFKDVLTRIKEMYGFEGGDLESYYQKLLSDYQKCEERADTVSLRIEKVEQVAEDLFREWETELNEITNDRLRSKSARSLKDTRNRYSRLHNAMTRAESGMAPVLNDLNNYVLYLKHNLNARAIGALKEEVDSIELEVETLIGNMSNSIDEAEAFIKTIE
jgi:hypothetical protein